MRRLFWLLFILLSFIAGIVLIDLMQRDSGYVLISVYGVSVETSFWFLVFSCIALAAILYFFWRLIKKAFFMVLGTTRWYHGKRSTRIESRYRQALLYFLTNDFSQAKRNLAKLGRSSDLPVVRILVEARCSFLCGDKEAALQLLTDAELSYPEEQVWLFKAQLAMLLELNRIDEASALLARLKLCAGADSSVEYLEYQLLKANSKPAEAAVLLPKLLKANQLGEHDVIGEYTFGLTLLLSQAEVDPAELETTWLAIPKKHRRNEQLLTQYAELLLKTQQHLPLEKLIVSELASQWMPGLVELFAKVQGKDLGRQLQLAESWLIKHGEHAELYLTLGVLSFENQLYGKARAYLDSSYALRADAQVLSLQAYIAEQLGEKELSFDLYKKASQNRRVF